MPRTSPSSAPLTINVAALLVSAALAIIAARQGALGEPWGWPLMAAAVAGFFAASAALPLTILIGRLASARVDAQPLEQGRSSELTLLQQIQEQTMLSDLAKRLVYRQKELQLLRSSIEEAFAHGDYDAALLLCTQMAEEFGYREEAESFRTSILHARAEHHEALLQSVMTDFSAALERRDWRAAHGEAARMRRLFPESPMLAELDGRINAAREEHKRDLERAFLDAAERNDVDEAMGLLRELDRFLSRTDAARLAQTAQAVVARHREGLSVQFKMAVSDRRWADAVRAGDRIVAEFPNSKMALEVLAMIDTLRTRASHAAVAAGR